MRRSRARKDWFRELPSALVCRHIFTLLDQVTHAYFARTAARYRVLAGLPESSPAHITLAFDMYSDHGGSVLHHGLARWRPFHLDIRLWAMIRGWTRILDATLSRARSICVPEWIEDDDRLAWYDGIVAAHIGRATSMVQTLGLFPNLTALSCDDCTLSCATLDTCRLLSLTITCNICALNLCDISDAAPNLESLALMQVTFSVVGDRRARFSSLKNLWLNDLFTRDARQWLPWVFVVPLLERLYVVCDTPCHDYSIHVPFQNIRALIIRTSLKCSVRRFHIIPFTPRSHITLPTMSHLLKLTALALPNDMEVQACSNVKMLRELKVGSLPPPPAWYARLGTLHPTLVFLDLCCLDHVTPATLRVICNTTASSHLLWLSMPARYQRPCSSPTFPNGPRNFSTSQQGYRPVVHLHIPTLRAFLESPRFRNMLPGLREIERASGVVYNNHDLPYQRLLPASSNFGDWNERARR
jgi:hypothetical protein